MKRNFCSSIAKDLDSSTAELKHSLILSEALSVEELNALYTDDEQQDTGELGSKSQLHKAVLPELKPIKNPTALPMRPVVASDDPTFEKDTSEPDSYVFKADKPYKLKFMPKTPTQVATAPVVSAMKEDYDYSPDNVLFEEDDVVAPIETAPIEIQKELLEPEVKVVKITVETEPAEEDEEKDSEKKEEKDEDESEDADYDMVSGIPQISKEELAQLASIVSTLNPGGRVVMSPAAQMFKEMPLGTISKVMTPEEDPDGYSVAGLDNDIGMNLL